MAKQTASLKPSALSPLCINESAPSGFTHVAVIEAADINNSAWTADGDTVEVPIFNATGKGVRAAMIVVDEAFVTDDALTASVGSASDNDGVVAAQNVKVAGVKSPVAGFAPATAGAGVGEQLYVTFATTASKGAPADIKSGRLRVFLQLV